MEAYLGAKIDYEGFIKELDIRLKGYFESFGENIKCKKGCSECCEKGDYPLTDIELAYLMRGFMALEIGIKSKVQQNIKNMEKGGVCPFLINHECSIYPYRPIICRVHGLAYFYKDEKVKLPYCVVSGKNYSDVYKDGVFTSEPITANLETHYLLEGSYAEIKNMYDWFHSNSQF